MFSIQQPCDSTFLKSRDAHFIMTLSEIGHDTFLFWVFKTACSSTYISSVAGRLLFNNFTKLWKYCQGSYFQTINCSPVLTCCLVGLVIELLLFFSSVFPSVDRHTQFDAVILLGSSSLLWKPCPLPSEGQSVWKFNDFFLAPLPTFPSLRLFVVLLFCLLLFCENPFVKYWHFLKYKYDLTDETDGVGRK